VLFCRGPAHLVARVVRGRRPGRTTLWGRRATHRGRPGWAPHGVARVVRTWRTHPGGHTGVTPTGAVYFHPGPARPGGYSVTAWGPARVRPGVTLPLRWVPVGTRVGRVGWAGRSSPAQVLRHRGGRVECRLGSRRTAWLDAAVTAVVGHAGVRPAPLATAGDAHRRGRRPRVRGVAMNPVDHPHGGGQGKTSGGRPGVTPWGRLTRGQPTVRR
jgi:hypothetical protein